MFMYSLHRMCSAAIEQRRLAPRCSNAFRARSFRGHSFLAALIFVCLVVPESTAQLTPTRPISKPTAPVTVTAPSLPQAVIAAMPAAPKVSEPEFRSVGNLPAILYDAPSVKAKKLSILSTFTPLELLARTDRWIKVRDAAGELGWVETSVLTERRLVTITAPIAQIRVAAGSTEAIAFEAERSVVLELVALPAPQQEAWVAVRHRDGNTGFVLRSQVFGH